MKRIFIRKVEDFNQLRELENEECIVSLENDIDFDAYYCYQKACDYIHDRQYNFIPIVLHNTNLIFEGNGNTLENMRIVLSNENNVGMFNTDDGSIVLIKNLIINNSCSCGKENVGLLGGTFNGVLNNSKISGIIIGNKTVGGLVGLSTKNLTINNSNVCVDVIAKETYGIVAGAGNNVTVNSSLLRSVDDENMDYAREYENLIIKSKERTRKIF